MVRAIASPIKHAILQLLQSRGYVLVRQADYASVMARAGSAGAAPAAPAEPVQGTPSFPPPPPEFASDVAEAREVEGFLKRARSAIGNNLPAHAAAVFVSARHLVKNRVSGDIIDCGDGSTTNLALMATALVMLADTSRRLVMFDVSGDASHRPDVELPLWGMDTSDLSDAQTARLARHADAPKLLPKELAATGYPADYMSIVRYPVDALDLSRPIAYLGMVADSYDSNRAAIRALFPRVSSNGILAVEGTDELRSSQPGCVQHQIDAVEQYLGESGRELSFWRAAVRYRVAINR